MKTSSKRLLKIVFLVLGLCALLGGGIKIYTAYQLHALSQTLQRAKEKRGEQQKSNAAAATADENTQSEAPTSQKEDQTTQTAAGTSTPTKARKVRQVSACTSVYQKYVEGRKARDGVAAAVEDFMELADRDKDLDNDPCVQQLTDLLDPDYLTGLMKKCSIEPNASKEARSACITMATLVWSVFAELEYRDIDPSEIPLDALHAKINFRLADHKKFLKEAEIKDKEYLFQLLDQMHKLRPDVEYGSLRDELIAELYSRDPLPWKDDYARVLGELENEDLLRAVATFYEGHGRKTDRPFLEYMEGLVKQHPENQVAHIYKGLAHAALNEWDLAARELAEAERLSPENHSRLVEELRQSIRDKKATFTTYSSISINMDLPDAKTMN